MGARKPGRTLIAGQAPRGLLVWRIYSYAPGSVSEAASSELGQIETTEPTGDSQNKGEWGGPIYGRVAAC